MQNQLEEKYQEQLKSIVLEREKAECEDKVDNLSKSIPKLKVDLQREKEINSSLEMAIFNRLLTHRNELASIRRSPR